MVARRLCIVVMAVAALAGCGNKVNEDELGRDEPAREGLAVEMGDLTYNVFITRQLNPRDAEDRDYYRGGEAQAGNTLYGVFLQVCNKTDKPVPAATEFTVTDTLGRVFYPTELADANLFAYRGGIVEAQNCIPKINSRCLERPHRGVHAALQPAARVHREPAARAQDRQAARGAGQERRSDHRQARHLAHFFFSPARSTSRAAGAAVSPPAPARTNSTPTASAGLRTGA